MNLDEKLCQPSNASLNSSVHIYCTKDDLHPPIIIHNKKSSAACKKGL